MAIDGLASGTGSTNVQRGRQQIYLLHAKHSGVARTRVGFKVACTCNVRLLELDVQTSNITQAWCT